MQPKRADRSGWRRRARSLDRWELVVTRTDCTEGDIWEALQKETYLRVPTDEELNREWEFATTLAGETPNDGPMRDERPRSPNYLDRMMRTRI